MYSKWFSHLPKNRKNEFTSQVLASQPVIKRLAEIIVDCLEESRELMKSKDNYSKSSWPYLQADLLGEQRAYERVYKLLDNILTKEEKLK